MRICVIGAHGSGNRLNGRMLSAAPHFWEVAVWSFPGGWRNATGFDFYVVSRREAEMTARSMLKEGMVPTIEKAREWVKEAEWEIRRGLGSTPFVQVWLEDTILRGADYTIARMAKALNVDPWPFDEAIYDANAQYGVLRG